MKTLFIVKTSKGNFVFNNEGQAQIKYRAYQMLNIPCQLIRKEVGLLNEKQTVLCAC